MKSLPNLLDARNCKAVCVSKVESLEVGCCSLAWPWNCSISRPWALNKVINNIHFCSDAPSCSCHIPCFSKTDFFIAQMLKYCYLLKERGFCSRCCLKEGPLLGIKQHFYLQILVQGFHQVTEDQSSFASEWIISIPY